MKTVSQATIEILNAIRTTEEVDAVRRGLEAFERSFYVAEKEDGLAKLRSFPRRIRGILEETLTSEYFAKDHDATRKFFGYLKKTLASEISILKMDIAFEPSESLIERASAWTKKELGGGIVLDIGVDRGLLGGARLIFGGKYQERTLPQMILRAIEEKKQIIAQQLQ